MQKHAIVCKKCGKDLLHYLNKTKQRHVVWSRQSVTTTDTCNASVSVSAWVSGLNTLCKFLDLPAVDGCCLPQRDGYDSHQDVQVTADM